MFKAGWWQLPHITPSPALFKVALQTNVCVYVCVRVCVCVFFLGLLNHVGPKSNFWVAWRMVLRVSYRTEWKWKCVCVCVCVRVCGFPSGSSGGKS